MYRKELVHNTIIFICYFFQSSEQPSNLVVPISIYSYSISSLPFWGQTWALPNSLFHYLSDFPQCLLLGSWLPVYSGLSWGHSWGYPGAAALSGSFQKHAAWTSHAFSSHGGLAIREQGMCVHPPWPPPVLAGIICAKLETAWVCSVSVCVSPILLRHETGKAWSMKNIQAVRKSPVHYCCLTSHLLD